MENLAAKKPREKVILGVMLLFYGVLSTRYFPGQPGKSLFETMTHIFSIAPINLGATLIIVPFLQKAAGQRLPWDRVVRIFLAVAVCVEILVGLAVYFQRGA